MLALSVASTGLDPPDILFGLVYVPGLLVIHVWTGKLWLLITAFFHILQDEARHPENERVAGWIRCIGDQRPQQSYLKENDDFTSNWIKCWRKNTTILLWIELIDSSIRIGLNVILYLNYWNNWPPERLKFIYHTLEYDVYFLFIETDKWH